MKITRIRIYRPKRVNPTFNQSDWIVTVETDAGITGIGEGGTRDTLEQCAAMLIGEDPLRSNHLWQLLYRGYFYPAGREKLHALGALDLALWDIRAKALNTPLYELLGGKMREAVECYSTGYPWQGSFGASAAACLQAGFRAYRTAVGDIHVGDIREGAYNARVQVERAGAIGREIRAAIGEEGEWSIDAHTRLDLHEAVRLCAVLEPFRPLYIEDPLRSENPGAYAALRPLARVPLAVGEQFGDRWDIHELIENHQIDYARVTIPNCGGITEFLKIAALCETHGVGMIPHFTGPVALAALAHLLASLPVPVLMEVTGTGPQLPPHLAQGVVFRDGKLWPQSTVGSGVVFDPAQAEWISDVSERYAPIPTYHRPDGSFTNW